MKIMVRKQPSEPLDFKKGATWTFEQPQTHQTKNESKNIFHTIELDVGDFDGDNLGVTGAEATEKIRVGSWKPSVVWKIRTKTENQGFQNKYMINSKKSMLPSSGTQWKGDRTALDRSSSVDENKQSCKWAEKKKRDTILFAKMFYYKL